MIFFLDTKKIEKNNCTICLRPFFKLIVFKDWEIKNLVSHIHFRKENNKIYD